MKKLKIFLLMLMTISLAGQVGINTQTPQTTLEVVGKPNDSHHFDGIIPPRISADQLAAKFFPMSTKGAVVFVTTSAQNLMGQVKYISVPGLYFFDGVVWQSISQIDPVEWRIVLNFDPENDTEVMATSNWSKPLGYYGDTNTFLTATKYYQVGTKHLGGLKGSVVFRKLQGIVDVKFQLLRSVPDTQISERILIDINKIYGDIGYLSNQIILLHTESSTDHFPALIENHFIQIPVSSFNQMSTTYYTYGEIQGYSNWVKPYVP